MDKSLIRRNTPWIRMKTFKNLNLILYVAKNLKIEFKKISDELMFEYSNLGFLFSKNLRAFIVKYSMNK